MPEKLAEAVAWDEETWVPLQTDANNALLFKDPFQVIADRTQWLRVHGGSGDGGGSGGGIYALGGGSTSAGAARKRALTLVCLASVSAWHLLALSVAVEARASLNGPLTTAQVFFEPFDWVTGAALAQCEMVSGLNPTWGFLQWQNTLGVFAPLGVRFWVVPPPGGQALAVVFGAWVLEISPPPPT